MTRFLTMPIAHSGWDASHPNPTQTNNSMKSKEQALNILSERYPQYKFLPFGSFLLGVEGDDLDIICITNGGCDFFGEFADSLIGVTNTGVTDTDFSVTYIEKISTSQIPIIKFELNGVKIDLLHAENESSPTMSGYHNTKAILDNVPNVFTFRDTLNIVKHWAKSRKIYGSTLCLFSGISLAIMVARVCQLYPHFNTFNLVIKFFQLYRDWEWPTPVVLEPIDGNTEKRSWNPKVHHSDRKHIMPVITPLYPHINTLHNMTKSTLYIIQAEMARAWSLLVRGVFYSEGSIPQTFNHYGEFTMKFIVDGDAGMFESKIRHLVKKLEKCPEIVYVYPWKIDRVIQFRFSSNSETLDLTKFKVAIEKISEICNSKIDYIVY